MPNVNDYKPLANSVDADVEGQAQYLLDLGPGGSLVKGYKTGTALSAQMNKTFRQTSMMSAALGQFISDALAVDVLDDGILADLVTKLKSAITVWSSAVFRTGDAKLSMQPVAEAGWVIMNDGSIGSAASAATTRANADTQALFVLIYNNTVNADCPVSGGRTGNAVNDFNANKRLTLPATLGRALCAAGAGAGLTGRALGHATGEETHVLVAGEMPTHPHDVSTIVNAQGYSAVGLAAGGIDARVLLNNGAPVSETGDSGGGAAHDNMQPSAFNFNVFIKL